MGAITTVCDFLDAIRTALDARAGLNGVTVWTGPVSETDLGTKCIVLAAEAESADLDQPLMGRAEVFEEYDVHGFIWATSTSPAATSGGTETAIGLARDAAFDIFEEVADYLASLTTTAATQSAISVDDANITGWEMEQAAGDDGVRHCIVKFTIHARARFTPA
jgi:hypothetical protein